MVVAVVEGRVGLNDRNRNSERVSHWCPSAVLSMHCQRKVPNTHNKLIPYRILSLPHLLSKPVRFRAYISFPPSRLQNPA